MDQINATDNQLIEFQEGRWLLFEMNGIQRRPLVEARRDGAVLFYRQDFGHAHGLPPGNWIVGDQVVQVVVGWVSERRYWLVGVQIRDSVTDSPRWCELVRFPTSPQDAYGGQAQRAARVLADVLNRPLRVIGGEGVDVPVQPVTAPPAVQRPPALTPQVAYTLPVQLVNQTLKEVPVGLRLAYSGRWMLNQVLQLLFYLALIALFGFVSSRSLVTSYAAVHEAWLPLAGFAVMVALAGVSILQALRMVRTADIIFDRDRDALYQVTTLGRWLSPLRRQARAPMPLRAIQAVVARNLAPNRKRAEWLLFVQTADEAVMLGESIETAQDQPPGIVQAAAAIADLLNVSLRIMSGEIR